MEDGRRLSEDSREIAQTRNLKSYAPPAPTPPKRLTSTNRYIRAKIAYLFIIYIGVPVSWNR